MKEEQMLDAYDRWERAKRDLRQSDAELEKARDKVKRLLDDEVSAKEALVSATNAANQARLLRGGAKPHQMAAIAEGEGALKRIGDALADARAALDAAERRRMQATSATAAALHGAQIARAKYGQAAIAEVQARIRSERALQAHLVALHRAMELGSDARIEVRLTATWEQMLLESFPRPVGLPRAA